MLLKTKNPGKVDGTEKWRMIWSGNLRHQYHFENTPIQIYWKFYNQKLANFQIKNSNISHISAQNIDYGYSFEPPRRGGSNEYHNLCFEQK